MIDLRRAPAVSALLIVTTAVFLLLWASGEEAAWWLRGAFLPARWSDPTLVLPPTAVPAWATPISAAFLHADVAHLLFNMLMLAIAGVFVEQALGSRLTMLLYLLGAYAAAGTEWALTADPMVPVIGASGAISAVVGVYAMLYSRRQVRAVGPLPAWLVRLVWLGAAWVVIQLLFGVAARGLIGPIAVWSHIGGFLAGAALARPLLLWRYRRA